MFVPNFGVLQHLNICCDYAAEHGIVLSVTKFSPIKSIKSLQHQVSLDWRKCEVCRPSQMSWCVASCLCERWQWGMWNHFIMQQTRWEAPVLSALLHLKTLGFMPMYVCQSWSKYIQPNIKPLRVAHNSAYQILHHIPSNESDRPHKGTHFVRTFDALIRRMCAFLKWCVSSSKFFWRSPL